jgi:predicted Fe-S protein YdhL (DUF1289 family)
MSFTDKSMPEVTSPCVRNCCLNNDDICLGCFRHINEILAWTSYKSSEKSQVVSACEQRRIALEKKLS